MIYLMKLVIIRLSYLKDQTSRHLFTTNTKKFAMTVGLFIEFSAFSRESSKSPSLASSRSCWTGCTLGDQPALTCYRPLVGQAPPLKVFFVEVSFQTPFFRKPPVAFACSSRQDRSPFFAWNNFSLFRYLIIYRRPSSIFNTAPKGPVQGHTPMVVSTPAGRSDTLGFLRSSPYPPSRCLTGQDPR